MTTTPVSSLTPTPPTQSRRTPLITPDRHRGRTAVITGGAQGIGRAYARRLAAEGAHVVIADIADAAPATAQITADGGEVSVVQCDVCDPGSVAALAAAVAELG